MQRRIAEHQWTTSTLTGLVVVVVAAAATAGCLGRKDSRPSSRNADAKEFTVTIAMNAISGGKNAASADWITNWVVPRFVADQKAKGRTAQVNFQPSGAGDEDYKSKISLDLKTGSGADIYSVDGIWVGESADAGYIMPIADLVGADEADRWDGWAQIPPAVQNNMSYNGKRYGVPAGTYVTLSTDAVDGALTSRVSIVEHLGATSLVTVEVDGVLVGAVVPEEAEPAPGTTVWLSPDPGRLLVYRADDGGLVA